MVTPARTILLLVGVLSSVATAQDRRSLCEVPPEIRKLNLSEVRARIDGGSTDFFLYARLLDLTPDIPKAGTLAPFFEQRLKEHPDDPKFNYLFARSLIGKRTPDAIEALDRVAKIDPDFPWTYLEFAKIYTSRNFHDSTKFAASIHTYRELCPASLEGYNWARSESDSVETAE